MATPLIVIALLFGLWLIAVAANRFKTLPRETHQRLLAMGLGLSFLFFALGHFVQTDAMIAMLPIWVPLRREIIYATGVAELIVAVGLFVPRWRTLAAAVAGLMLVAFFPANVYAAMNSVGMGGHAWGPIYLLVRVPLQLLLIAVVFAILGRWPYATARACG